MVTTSNELENVKVGDILIHDGIGFSGGKAKTKATKITKTQIHTKNIKFRKSDGRRVGAGGWDFDHIRLPKEGEAERMEHYRAIERAKNVLTSHLDKEKLTDEQLKEFVDKLQVAFEVIPEEAVIKK